MKLFSPFLAWSSAIVLALASALTASGDDDETLPLPRWTEEELRAMGPLGTPPGFGVLLNPDREAYEVAPLELADSPERTQPASDLSRFLPPSLMVPLRPDQRPRSPNPVTLVRVLRDVSQGFLDQAMQAPAAMLLIDPNGQLHESAHEEFQRFLEFHARDARIAMHVLLMGENEQLPPDVNLSRLAGGSLLQGRSCAVVVPMGDVARTRLFLSRDVIEAAKDVDLTDLLEDVVKHAQSSPEIDDQLHRLLVRLSVRLFWLERKLPSPAPVETVQRAIVVNDGTHAPLLEVGRPRTSAWSIVWLTLGIAATGGIGFFVYQRWLRHKRRTHEWTLPEMTHLEPRFGGTHCGGAAGVAWT